MKKSWNRKPNGGLAEGKGCWALLYVSSCDKRGPQAMSMFFQNWLWGCHLAHPMALLISQPWHFCTYFSFQTNRPNTSLPFGSLSKCSESSLRKNKSGCIILWLKPSYLAPLTQGSMNLTPQPGYEPLVLYIRFSPFPKLRSPPSPDESRAYRTAFYRLGWFEIYPLKKGKER